MLVALQVKTVSNQGDPINKVGDDRLLVDFGAVSRSASWRIQMILVLVIDFDELMDEL